ncbi:hypothetical protein IJ076_00105 [Candidatus Saccharibacteria bacterium]|nr:hypothetical protein [Candidatus Saccharibacteria bacterium]
MRIVCVFKEGRDYSRTVTDYLEDFYRRTGHQIETMDPDESTNFCEAYDIVEYPTILAIDGNGAVASTWKGMPLPLFDEISYYASA